MRLELEPRATLTATASAPPTLLKGAASVADAVVKTKPAAAPILTSVKVY